MLEYYFGERETLIIIVNHHILFFIPFQLAGTHVRTLKTQNAVLIMSYTAVK